MMDQIKYVNNAQIYVPNVLVLVYVQLAPTLLKCCLHALHAYLDITYQEFHAIYVIHLVKLVQMDLLVQYVLQENYLMLMDFYVLIQFQHVCQISS